MTTSSDSQLATIPITALDRYGHSTQWSRPRGMSFHWKEILLFRWTCRGRLKWRISPISLYSILSEKFSEPSFIPCFLKKNYYLNLRFNDLWGRLIIRDVLRVRQTNKIYVCLQVSIEWDFSRSSFEPIPKPRTSRINWNPHCFLFVCECRGTNPEWSSDCQNLWEQIGRLTVAVLAIAWLHGDAIVHEGVLSWFVWDLGHQRHLTAISTILYQSRLNTGMSIFVFTSTMKPVFLFLISAPLVFSFPWSRDLSDDPPTVMLDSAVVIVTGLKTCAGYG